LPPPLPCITVILTYFVVVSVVTVAVTRHRHRRPWPQCFEEYGALDRTPIFGTYRVELIVSVFRYVDPYLGPYVGPYVGPYLAPN